jgi:hypothetical protein
MMQQISWRIPFVSESLAAIHPKNSLLTPNHRLFCTLFVYYCGLLNIIHPNATSICWPYPEKIPKN